MRAARQKPPSVAAGFTLLEVLVAVAILAVALGAAIRIGAQTAANVVELRERAYAGWVAENEVARVQAGIEPLSGPALRGGGAEMGGMEWEWELTAERAAPPIPVDIDLEGLLHIEVRVFREGESERAAAVRTAWLRLPGPAGDGEGVPDE